MYKIFDFLTERLRSLKFGEVVIVWGHLYKYKYEGGEDILVPLDEDHHDLALQAVRQNI